MISAATGAAITPDIGAFEAVVRLPGASALEAQDPAPNGRTKLPVEPKEAFKSIREVLSARQVFGEPVARDGVTMIPAAT